MDDFHEHDHELLMVIQQHDEADEVDELYLFMPMLLLELEQQKQNDEMVEMDILLHDNIVDEVDEDEVGELYVFYIKLELHGL